MAAKDPTARRAYQNQRNKRRAAGARLIHAVTQQEEQAIRWLQVLGVLERDAEGWAWVDPQKLVQLVGNVLEAQGMVLGAGSERLRDRLSRHQESNKSRIQAPVRT